jgi:lambda family phage portal protein
MMTYQQRVAAFKSQHGIGRRNLGPNKVFKRGYEAGGFNRLTADMHHLNTSTADSEIRYDLVSLRNRARMQERENAYVSRYLKALTNNVIQNEVGFSLQMKATRPPEYVVQDTIANAKIEQAWKEWCKKENCTESMEDSFYDICRLTVRSTPRDGGIMFHKVIDPNVNEFGFALKPIEIDLLDVNMNEFAPNGNRITMGVEKDKRSRTVAYHLLERHPGDLLYGQQKYNRQRIPANEIIHYFVKERITQCVGVPWIAPALLRVHHLDQYEQAEIVAAREAAVKGGYFTSERGDQYSGEEETDAEGAATGNTISNFEAGQKDELPPGMTFVPYDPQHPMSQYGDFVKNSLFGICAGLDISYATLTGDLSNANYSSMRAGKIEEQESYKTIQCHMINHLCTDIFTAWLEVAITNGIVNLPMSKFRLFNKPKFTGRRWPWVDPQKDITAALMEINGGLNTRTQISEENGRDLEEIYQTLADEKALAEEHGLTFVNPNTGGGPNGNFTEVEDPKKETDDTEEVTNPEPKRNEELELVREVFASNERSSAEVQKRFESQAMEFAKTIEKLTAPVAPAPLPPISFTTTMEQKPSRKAHAIKRDERGLITEIETTEIA